MKKLAPFLPAVLLLVAGCSGLKYVPKGELLYTGAKIQVIANAKIKETGAVKSGAKKVLRPSPNLTFLGMRPRLWMYYHTREPKKPKGLRNWEKYKLGEPPVYLSSVDATLLTRGIDAGLYNTGYMDSYSQCQVATGKRGKTASLAIKIYLNPPYKIRDISFPTAGDTLSRMVAKTERKTLIKKGNRYSLDVLLKERERIDAHLKKRGFYYFRPDYILFKMDTTGNDRKMHLDLTLKPDIPPKARLVYHIGEVNVYPDYRLGDSSGTVIQVIDSINYYKGSDFIRPRAVLRCIFFKPGQTYSSTVQQTTLNRLTGLAVFKFINVEVHDRDTTSNGLLTANIRLTALPRYSISAEADAVTESNDFAGPGLTLSLRNRNAFRGAELMIYNVRGSFEAQYSGQFKGLFNYEFNPKVELDVPRILSAFPVHSSNLYVPHTSFSLEYDYLSQVGYFDMNTIKLTYGYKWKPTAEIDQQINPVNIEFYNIYHTTTLFNALIDSNPLVANRFMEQFVPGLSYSFFYNQQVHTTLRNQFYFNANIKLAGNMVSVVNWLFTRRWPSSNNPTQILGVDYAQFTRLDIDVRDYFHITHDNVFVARFIAGWGLAYGNAYTLPYAYEFFSGGAYSLRGFPGNSVGPGTYSPPDSVKNVFYQQQGGEIRLEANAEYRFPIIGVLKGAVFLDAGNTWLNHSNPNAPGGVFLWDEFLNQLAVSTGAGLRVDLNFFVIRLDIGLPLRNPSYPEDQRWVIKDTDFSSLLFNFAFGYPF